MSVEAGDVTPAHAADVAAWEIYLLNDIFGSVLMAPAGEPDATQAHVDALVFARFMHKINGDLQTNHPAEFLSLKTQDPRTIMTADYAVDSGYYTDADLWRATLVFIQRRRNS